MSSCELEADALCFASSNSSSTDHWSKAWRPYLTALIRPSAAMRNSAGSPVGPPVMARLNLLPIPLKAAHSARHETFSSKSYYSGFAAEADEVVKFEQVGPGLNVFAGLGEFGDGLGEELQRFRVAVRAAAIYVIAPLLDFPRCAFVFGVGLNPFQDFTIAPAFLQSGEKLIRVNPHEAEDALVQRAVEVVFAVLASDGCTSFIEHAREQGVSA